MDCPRIKVMYIVAWDHEDERPVEIVFCGKNMLDEWSVARVCDGLRVATRTSGVGSQR